MFARFLEDDDQRMTEIGDFTVVVGNSHTDKVIKEFCYIDTSFTELANHIAAKYKSGVTMSVLDYGDEIQAVLTPNNVRSNHCYTIYRN